MDLQKVRSVWGLLPVCALLLGACNGGNEPAVAVTPIPTVAPLDTSAAAETTATEATATVDTTSPLTSTAETTATEEIGGGAEITATATLTEEAVELRIETVASGLEVPKVLAFAPDGRLFVAERPGRVRIIEEGILLPTPAITLADIRVDGEHGLSGMTLSPDFASNHYVYLYYTYSSGEETHNRVVRYVEEDNSLIGAPEIMLAGIPTGMYHDGGVLAFGPDGKLYVTTGDARQAELAQDLTSLAGKILRLNPDGSIPDDNPFPGSPVYSLGHRNSQGMVWQPETNQLYATEHGETGNDEVNLIRAGQNYGWPDAEGDAHPEPFRAPLATYSPAVAPAAAVFYTADLIPQWRGSFLFATLRGSHLHRLVIEQSDPVRVTGDERLFEGQFGRLRAVAQGPDGALYFTTSNQEGRADRPPQDPADDRILRVVPAAAPTADPTADTAAEDRAAIEANYRRQQEAMINGDVATLRTLLADEASATHITGYQQPREEWFAQIQSGYFDYHSITPQSLEITIIDETHAILVARNLIDVTIGGSRNTWQIESTSNYVKQDGQWLGGDSSSTTY